MKKYLFVLFLILQIGILLAARRALVIGNSSYSEQALRTPANDAEDVASVLSSLGFEVQKHSNLNQAQMMRTITQFSESLNTADEVVFYYAGHGVQIDGLNYLMPVSPQILDKYDAVAYSYSLNLLLEKLSRPEIVIVFLDTCRNNTYSWSRSLQNGLAGIETASNSQFIITSTRAGSEAQDGSGRNSPFAEALIKNICEPQPVEELARDIVQYVEKATKQRQTPSVYGNLRKSYSLAKLPELKTLQTANPVKLEAQSKPEPSLASPNSQAQRENADATKPFGILEIRANMDGDIYLNDNPYPIMHLMQDTMKSISSVPAGKCLVTMKTIMSTQTKEIIIPPNQVIEISFTFEKTIIPPGFKIVPGGSFEMGSSEADEKPVHKVNIDPFYMSYTELTVGEFREFVDATGYLSTAEKKRNAYTLNTSKMLLERDVDASWHNPGFTQNDRHPVTCVSWYDAIAYCNWRSIKEGLKPCYYIKGNPNPVNWQKGLIQCDFKAEGYRLPTEAEWEFAARGNNPLHRFSGGNEIAQVALHYFNSQDRTWEVASKGANSFGLYDLTGNVGEWCWDWYDANYYNLSVSSNPRGPHKVTNKKVVRGGSWYDDETRCSVTFRYPQEPDYAESGIGFRLVQVAP